MSEVIESTALEVADHHVPARLFAGQSGQEIIQDASEKATALAGVIESRKLFTEIRGRKHVRVEGWTLLGSLVGVFPVCVWTKPLNDGWEARVEARTLDGNIVGAAEAQCTKKERMWADRDDYALRSMAQTRATSKALRQPLGFIMVLGNYDATPAEEMPHDEPSERPQERREPPKQEAPASWPTGTDVAWWADFMLAAKESGVEASHLHEVIGVAPTAKTVKAWMDERDMPASELLSLAILAREAVEDGV